MHALWQVDALARARPRTLAELQALKRIPRFSKNKRDLYGADIIVALQQARGRRFFSLPTCLTAHTLSLDCCGHGGELLCDGPCYTYFGLPAGSSLLQSHCWPPDTEPLSEAVLVLFFGGLGKLKGRLLRFGFG